MFHCRPFFSVTYRCVQAPPAIFTSIRPFINEMFAEVGFKGSPASEVRFIPTMIATVLHIFINKMNNVVYESGDCWKAAEQ